MPKFITADDLKRQKAEKPRMMLAEGVDLRKEIRVTPTSNKQNIAEFIGSKDFPKEFRTLQQYELDAGRDSEPLLYNSIYRTVTDPNLPQFIPIYRTGPAGVVFDEVLEGGEVKFASVNSSQATAQIKHYAVGLEYSKDLIMYNYTWQVGMVERQAGVAFNALLNHVHLYPIINYAYAADNQTAAVTGAGSLENNYLRTLEAAILAGENDTTNPRRGPYALLISNSNRFTMERALTGVGQQTYEAQGSVVNAIDTVIAYNGWTGTRGKIATTYTGVTTNKAYLISLQYRDLDFQSFMKQGLQTTMGNEDVSRFILEQQIWDAYFGVYANPVRAVEEITLPTSAS